MYDDDEDERAVAEVKTPDEQGYFGGGWGEKVRPDWPTLREWLEQFRGDPLVSMAEVEAVALDYLAPEEEDRSWLTARDHYPISEKMREAILKQVEKLRAGLPLGYVRGYKDFYGRRFRIYPEVLVPRDETEELIEIVKQLDLPKRPRFLDAGTGCGCIAITLALEFPQAEVAALDISEDALQAAEDNNVLLEGRVELYCSDLLKGLTPRLDGPFDVIVANLPYVNPNWDFIDRRHLAYEPAIALYALEENGLSVYRRLFEQLVEWRGAVKYLVIEIDPCQREGLEKMAREFGWKIMFSQGYGVALESA